MSHSNNAVTWDSFKKGDWDAYTALYNEHFSLLNNYGYKFTRDISLIEDSVHDLFVRLWATRQNLGNPVSVRNYLFKSLRHILLRKIQKTARFSERLHEDYYQFEVSFAQHPPAAMEDKELQQQVRCIIDSLPARQQEIIYLRFYEGLSYDEIADIMSISVNSTYKLLYKALHNLQATMGSSLVVSLLYLHQYFAQRAPVAQA
jgi:RNA polymerase sigma factor (sigma-70 family)